MRLVRLQIIFWIVTTIHLFAEERWQGVLDHYCLECHDNDLQRGEVNIEALLDQEFELNTDHWEKVLRLIDARQMPPVGEARPTEDEYQQAVADLTRRLDQHAQKNPNPGRTDSIRRLTRYEYKNAIRDLLHLDIDPTELLPADESSHGFDNITVTNLSAELLNRYLSAGQKIARLAIGGDARVSLKTYRVAPDLTQEDQVLGLPIGSRGGILIEHQFPVAGEYDIRVFLTRDRNEMIEGMRGNHELHFLINNELQHQIELKPPKGMGEHTSYNDNLRARLSIPAGPQKVGITFPKLSNSLETTLRQPYEAHYNHHRHPRLSPAVFQVVISGPFNTVTTKPSEADTPSRLKIFGSKVDDQQTDQARAREVISRIIRQAYRQPVTEAEIERIYAFYESSRKLGADFDGGIESAIAAILVSRKFLFRTETEPPNLPKGSRYLVSDVELASRLSFFLWSSLPDEELVAAAEAGGLSKPEGLQQQALRMLRDPKAESLVENFADQWLYLRNLDSIAPDGRLFPGFDDNLRQAFKEETRALFRSMVEADQSIQYLLKPKQIYLNERLAKHYQIPHVYGSRFRFIDRTQAKQRGGLLRNGSILMATSYATRTSPVIRGNWILENILGTPPPPPPPDIPSLDDVELPEDLPVRQRLAKHREKAACASCHDVMDPIGFALENFDAIGQWREQENGYPIDSSGKLAFGGSVNGVAELEAQLLAHPDRFARTLAEKLLTYALGRGVESSDAPAIRQIVSNAREKDYRFSALICGMVTSEPFRFRTSTD